MSKRRLRALAVITKYSNEVLPALTTAVRATFLVLWEVIGGLVLLASSLYGLLKFTNFLK